MTDKLVIAPAMVQEMVTVPVVETVEVPILEKQYTAVNVPKPVLDEQGQPVLDENGDPVTEEVFSHFTSEWVDTGETRPEERETGTTEEPVEVERIVGTVVAMSAAQETAFVAGQDDDQAKLEKNRAEKAAQIDAEYERDRLALFGAYPDSEVDSWPQQAQEAAQYRAQGDDATGLGLLPGMATARGITVAELVTRIETKAAAFKAAYAPILGERQRRQDELASIDLAAPTALAEIEAV